MSINLIVAVKGSAKSGNYGHAGIPGHVGGSAPNKKADALALASADTILNNRPAGFENATQRGNGISDTVVLGPNKRIYVTVEAIPNSAGYSESIRGKYVVNSYDNKDREVGQANVYNNYDDAKKDAETRRAGLQAQVKPVTPEPELLALKDGSPARIIDNVADVKGTEFGKGYFILGDKIDSPHKGKIVDISSEFGGGTNDHPGFIAGSTNPELFGMTNKQANAFYRSYMKGDYTPAMQTGWDKIFSSGAIRVRQFPGSGVNLDTQKLDTPTMRRLQTLYGENKLDFKPGKDNYWADASGDYIKFNLEDLLNSRTVERLQRLASQH